MKSGISILILALIVGLAPFFVFADSVLTERLKGYILLQVESHGEAWYVNPDDGLRYYMQDGDAAYELMRFQSLGITNSDLSLIPSVSSVDLLASRSSVCSSNALAGRLKGRILLQVQSHGEAWYVDPVVCYRVYMSDGVEAYNIMRLRSLGITNADLATIPAYADSEPDAEPVPSPVPDASPNPDNASPFASYSLYVRTNNDAAEQIEELGTSDPEATALLQRIAQEPIAEWFGDWNDDVRDDVDDLVSAADAEGAIAILAAYNIPNRDCGDGYSSGGTEGSSEYHEWISDVADGIGSRPAIVILEADAVALDCFTDERGDQLADAVDVLKENANTYVYIDAGHPNWTPVETMATRLEQSGIEEADGFALNVSNFYTTEENIEFGNELSELLDGKHYVIDTSRNANGWQGEWCNPLGAGIGESPTTNTGEPLLDALLWVKTPGGSDGECNGGPKAGYWWLEYALQLVEQGV